MAGRSASAEPVKIRLSWVAPIANIGSLIMEKKDLAVHMGKSYVLEPVRYQGTPPMITALANNELEVADLAYSTLPIAIQNAGMDDLRVISDEFQDGVEGYYSNEFFVLKDGPIRRSRTSRARSSPPTPRAARSTSRRAPCCAARA